MSCDPVSERGASAMRPIHRTVPIQIWVDVDDGIADFVFLLNMMPGVRTHSSCQGTVGEGGAEPYPPYVSVSWGDDAAREALKRFELVIEYENFGTVRPPAGRGHV